MTGRGWLAELRAVDEVKMREWRNPYTLQEVL